MGCGVFDPTEDIFNDGSVADPDRKYIVYLRIEISYMIEIKTQGFFEILCFSCKLL